ncbi:MAG: hypothetical protein HYV60_20665 [Planctomycetia bacterium]|nr:hypothetical protein [Planctomycetia bacterium]
MEFSSGVPATAGETGLTSLDVVLPERGVEYLFTTPRGDIEITAHNISKAQIDRVLGLLGILAILIGLTVAYRIGRAIVARTSPRALAITCILLGVVSIIGGVLPLVGIVLIAWGVSRMIRQPTRTTQVAGR